MLTLGRERTEKRPTELELRDTLEALVILVVDESQSMLDLSSTGGEDERILLNDEQLVNMQ